MEHLGGFFPTPGYCDEEMHFYLATGLREPNDSDPTVRQDEDEDIESKAFSVDEIRRHDRRGCDRRSEDSGRDRVLAAPWIADARPEQPTNGLLHPRLRTTTALSVD